MSPRPVALLTDFGHRDPFAGVCHAVILREDPTIPIIDLTHGIARQDVRAGAVAVADAVPYLPEDTVVVAVVDPGVGSDRKALAVEATNGLVFVGPDNGLLALGLEAAGGAAAAFEIGHSPWRLEPVSNTFHGRDIFCPVGARIAAGAPIVEAGVAIDHDDLVQIETPPTAFADGQLTTAVVAVDEYGNARLAATPEDLNGLAEGGAAEIATDDVRCQVALVQTYADAESDAPVLIVDSSGSLSIAIGGGDAAAALGLFPGKIVRVIPA